MKTNKHITLILVSAAILMLLSSITAYAQEKHGPLDNIIIYKPDSEAGSKFGSITFKEKK